MKWQVHGFVSPILPGYSVKYAAVITANCEMSHYVHVPVGSSPQLLIDGSQCMKMAVHAAIINPNFPELQYWTLYKESICEVTDDVNAIKWHAWYNTLYVCT
jgi:hypothetical protein